MKLYVGWIYHIYLHSTGITSLSCVRLGCRSVVMTDIGDLVQLMTTNVCNNFKGMYRKDEEFEEKRKNGENDCVSSDDSLSTLLPSLSSLSLSSPLWRPLFPSFSQYPACTNCEDMESVYYCEQCYAYYCSACVKAWHTPSKYSHHTYHPLFSSSSSSCASPCSSSTSHIPATLPDTCDVYCTELYWGTNESDLSPPLHQSFDLILAADVIYDAYSTVGTGSDKVGVCHILYETVKQMCKEESVMLLTYTPRRAEEAEFFTNLSQEFYWCKYKAEELMSCLYNSNNSSSKYNVMSGDIDSRIEIYMICRIPPLYFSTPSLLHRIRTAQSTHSNISPWLVDFWAREERKQRQEMERKLEERKNMKKRRMEKHDEHDHNKMYD